jgi:hypothetical protein
MVIIIPIDYQDASGQPNDSNGNAATVPAGAYLERVYIVREIAWDALTSFTLGKSDDADWLVTDAQHNLTGAAPAVEVVEKSETVAAETAITATWNQGTAAQGLGYVIVQYLQE